MSRGSFAARTGWLAGLALGCGFSAFAQTTTPAAVRETVRVVGDLDPVTEGQSQRATTAHEVAPQRLTVDGVDDILREDSSVDVQQRGGGGVQSDLSIRGSGYEQTLVLLNGLRINDAETSHFNLDVPVPMEALGGAYVLHGAGSTLYGSDAVSGVVNLTTAKPQDGLVLQLRAGAGSFGGNTQAALASYSRGHFSEVMAGGRDFSEGFIADRDFRSEEVSSETRVDTSLGETDVLVAGSDRAFGAAGFYGDYPSYERTKGWFGAITQELGSKMSAALAYRRHSDIFVLDREDPAEYKNQHIDTSWQGVVRREDVLPWRALKMQYGLDINADTIVSNSLGDHGRNRGAGYLNTQLRTTEHGSVSIGLREEIFDGGRAEFVPAFSASQYFKDKIKLRGAISRGFRLPTYTDLYYTSPTENGNPNLKPESAWSYEAGVDWYPGAKWAISATEFTSRQTNAIDYVRANDSQPWDAANLTQLQLTGAEFSAEWRPAAGQQIKLSLTALTGTRGVLSGLQSLYVFNYPSQNAVAEWNGRWKNGFVARGSLRVVNRIGWGVYPVVDSSLAYEGWRVHPYVQMTNLSNTSYQEIVGVPMPSRAFAGGLEFQFKKK